jgi:hypothetical protein
MNERDPHIAETFGPLERDPNGTSPHTSGAKLDAGKNRIGLVMLGFSRALQEVSKVGTYGADKYTDDGWMSVPDGERRYTDAMLRHMLKEGAGEQFDPDTALLHAAHTAWNALARLDLMLRRPPVPVQAPVQPPSKHQFVMPQCDVDYQIFFTDGTSCKAVFKNNQWYDYETLVPITRELTHWTPI